MNAEKGILDQLVDKAIQRSLAVLKAHGVAVSARDCKMIEVGAAAALQQISADAEAHFKNQNQIVIAE